MKQKTNNQPATPYPSNTEQVEGFTKTAKDILLENEMFFTTAEDLNDEYINAAAFSTLSVMEQYAAKLKADNKVLLEALKNLVNQFGDIHGSSENENDRIYIETAKNIINKALNQHK